MHMRADGVNGHHALRIGVAKIAASEIPIIGDAWNAINAMAIPGVAIPHDPSACIGRSRRDAARWLLEGSPGLAERLAAAAVIGLDHAVFMAAATAASMQAPDKSWSPDGCMRKRLPGGHSLVYAIDTVLIGMGRINAMNTPCGSRSLLDWVVFMLLGWPKPSVTAWLERHPLSYTHQSIWDDAAVGRELSAIVKSMPPGTWSINSIRNTCRQNNEAARATRLSAAMLRLWHRIPDREREAQISHCDIRRWLTAAHGDKAANDMLERWPFAHSGKRYKPWQVAQALRQCIERMPVGQPWSVSDLDQYTDQTPNGLSIRSWMAAAYGSETRMAIHALLGEDAHILLKQRPFVSRRRWHTGTMRDVLLGLLQRRPDGPWSSVDLAGMGKDGVSFISQIAQDFGQLSDRVLREILGNKAGILDVKPFVPRSWRTTSAEFALELGKAIQDMPSSWTATMLKSRHPRVYSRLVRSNRGKGITSTVILAALGEHPSTATTAHTLLASHRYVRRHTPGRTFLAVVDGLNDDRDVGPRSMDGRCIKAEAGIQVVG